MLLTIDVGNTNIAMGLFDGQKLLRQRKLPTDVTTDPLVFEETIRLLLENQQVQGGILASVVPQVNEKLCSAAEKVTGKSCLVVSYDMKMEMPLKVDEPPTIGADLIAGCVGAMENYPLPVIVADLGTANTLMAVNGRGEFIGGLIAPGLAMQLQSLGAGTSLLPDLGVEVPKKCIGANTAECLESGVVYGTAAMLDGMIERMNEELGQEACVVATGGSAALVASLCRHKIICDPDLLLKGLSALYEKNT